MEIDQLSIGIETTAKDTISTINTLNQKLNILATSLGKINGSAITELANGVNRLSTAMQGMKSVGTADFTRLAKNIEKLGNMDVAGLNAAASSLSHISRTLSGFESASAASAQLGDMAKNIAKLGNKSVQTAITNIPLLATAMKDLMQTLSTAPRVSQNLIDMTNALSNFTQQGSKVSVVSGTLVSGLNRSSKAMNNAKKSSMSLAAAFGKFYATYFLLIRGVKKLWGSIQSSFDYLEVLNYFDAAFGQVAENADLSAFEKMGYESADAYYGSFAKRAEEVTRKMSGFTIGENGLLQSTGAVSLGLDPSKLMNYQAMFGQMSSSMGVASETALKLSQALTEIGADLASVKNLDFESVWNDMASGLAGMSRTLDKYGVNIRNVNLQQKLMELGIDANIQSLNQNDKALLRAIILLENTKYAWGDLADTINQPANQLRLIQANFENLGRTIGNLFLPIVKTVLPYVNALVIAVQRLFSWLGNLIGLDISDISTSIGGADMGDILDQTEDLESGLGGAKKAADKLNKSLRQFDELKVINTKQDDGGTGAGAGIQGGLLDAAFEDAFSKYQQEWDKAFSRLENRAQEIADRIEKAFEPLNKIIQDFAIGDFFQAGKDTSALVAGIFNFFADAIDRVDWYGIGKKIGDFFAGLDWTAIFKAAGKLMRQGLKAAFELWKGSFDAAPIETAFLTILALPGIVGFGSKLVALIVNPFKNIFGLLSPIISGIGGLFTEGGVFGAGGLIASASAPVIALTAVFAAFVAGLGYVFATNEEVRESFSQAISAIKDGLQPAIEFVTNTLLPDLNAGWERLMEILSPLGTFLNDMFVSIWQDMINPALTYIGETVLPTLTGAFENLWNNVLVPLGSFLGDVLEPVIKIVSDALTILWDNVVIPLANAVGNILGKAFESTVDVFNNFTERAKGLIKILQFLWNDVLKPQVQFLWDVLKPVFEEVFKSIGEIIDGLSKALGGLLDFIGGVFSGDWGKAWEGIKNIFSGIMETMAAAGKMPINAIIGLFEGLANKVIDAWNWIKEAINSISVDTPFGHIGFDLEMTDHINIPRLAKGGITLKHTFAEIGEMNRPEAVLPLSDRKAMGMVADSIYENYNGNSVDAGFSSDVIEAAVYRATYNAVSSAIANSKMLGDIKDLVAEGKTVTIGQDEIGRASVNYIQGEERRLQKSLVGTY